MLLPNTQSWWCMAVYSVDSLSAVFWAFLFHVNIDPKTAFKKKLGSISGPPPALAEMPSAIMNL